jgi:dTDP-4-dehydrorhamnose reductase
MKIAVTGANGQLGSDLVLHLSEQGHELHELNHQDVDVTQEDAVRDRVRALRPDVVINTAAYHHPESCELHPERAFRVNALGARNLAEAAREAEAYLIHISTDYVFDGAKGAPYVETDRPAPLNVYGNTKLAGEHFVLAAGGRALVLRTSGLYGRHPCRAKGRNFVDLMLHLGAERKEVRVVDNEVLTPTSTLEVARQVAALCEQPLTGTAHATAEGACSWHRFAREIFDRAGVTAKLSVALPDEFPVKTPRPAYSVLENAALKHAGLNRLRPWQDGLREFLETRRQRPCA